MSGATTRLLPAPTPETAAFWRAANEGRLLLQRCGSCDKALFPPRPFCPSCHSTDLHKFVASGRAVLWSYVISMRAAPGIQPPYVVAVVKLAEGVTMMTNIINCPMSPEHLALDMPLRVVFSRQNDDISLPLFEPDAEAVWEQQ